MRKWNRGFTLIELLVVIAIIAILAAILFPVFANVRERGRQATCQNNMKQYAVAVHSYRTDNNEWWPVRYMLMPGQTAATHPEVADMWKNPGRPGWIHNVVRQYINTTAIMQCPSIKVEGISWHPPVSYDDYSLGVDNTVQSTLCYNYTYFHNMSDPDITVQAEAAVMWDSLINAADEMANLPYTGATNDPGSKVPTPWPAGNYDTVSGFRTYGLMLQAGDIRNWCANWKSGCKTAAGIPVVANSYSNWTMWHNKKGNVVWADGHATVTNFGDLRMKNLYRMIRTAAHADAAVTAFRCTQAEFPD